MSLLNLFIFIWTSLYTIIFHKYEIDYTINFINNYYPELLIDIYRFWLFGQMYYIYYS